MLDFSTRQKLTHAYSRQLILKFQETNSVANRKKINLDYFVKLEAAQIEFLGQFLIDPSLSTRQAATGSGLSRESVRKVLRLHKFHRYEMQILQELGEDDTDRRIHFCEVMTDIIIAEPRRKRREPTLLQCKAYAIPPKINVWTDIMGLAIIGPLMAHKLENHRERKFIFRW